MSCQDLDYSPPLQKFSSLSLFTTAPTPSAAYRPIYNCMYIEAFIDIYDALYTRSSFVFKGKFLLILNQSLVKLKANMNHAWRSVQDQGSVYIEPKPLL